MKTPRLSIEDGFTLPSERTTCRKGDVPVDGDTYELLKLAEKYKRIKAVTVDTQSGIEVEIARGDIAAKAVLATALQKHNTEKGFRNRVNQIVQPIGKAIVEYLGCCDFGYILNAVGDSAFVLLDQDIDIPKVGGLSSFSSTGACFSTDSQREHFLYKVEDAVKKIVLLYLKRSLVFRYRGKSFWDIRMPKISICNIKGSNDRVKVLLQLWPVPEKKET